MIEKLRAWLMTYPGWGNAQLGLDYVENIPGRTGLFYHGYTQLKRSRDVVGNLWLRGRQELVLQRVTSCDAETDALWVQGLEAWIREQCALGLAPRFGVRDESVIRAEKGRLKKRPLPGTAVYELPISVEYTEMFET